MQATRNAGFPDEDLHKSFLFSIFCIFPVHPHPWPSAPVETPSLSGGELESPLFRGEGGGVLQGTFTVFSEPRAVEWLLLKVCWQMIRIQVFEKGGWGWLQVPVWGAPHLTPPPPTNNMFPGVLWVVWVAGCRVFSKSVASSEDLHTEVWFCHRGLWSCWLRNLTESFKHGHIHLHAWNSEELPCSSPQFLAHISCRKHWQCFL